MLQKTFTWIQEHRWLILHVLISLAVFALLCPLTGPSVAAFCVIAWAWTDAMAKYRIGLIVQGVADVPSQLKSLWPGAWPLSLRVDLLAPAVLVLLLAVIVRWVTR